MASTLKVLFDILCKLRFTKDYINRCFKRWALFLAFLGRRLCDWRSSWWHRKPGTVRKSKPAKPLFPGTVVHSGSLSGSVERREYVVAAASILPTSVSHPSLHEPSLSTSNDTGQLATTSGPGPIPPGTPANLTVDPHQDYAHSISSLDGRNFANRNSSNLSVHSRASDRLSVLQAHSRESLRGPVGQPSRFPRAVHRQFGRGPSASRSRERPSRSPSPTSHLPHVPRVPRLEIDVTNLRPNTHADDRVSPAIPPSVSSHTHAPLSPPIIPGRRQSSTSVIVGIENPSTESLPLSPSSNLPPLTDEPYAIGSPTAHSSHASLARGLPLEELSPLSPTASSVISNFLLPEHRFVQLINSDQVPRYTKDITIPREETLYEVKTLTVTFPYFPENSDSDEGSFKQDCSPWAPATHPDGALYFFDQNRRLFTDTDMHDPTLREEMEDFHDYLQKIIRVERLTIPSKNWDLVLDIMPTEDGEIQWSYYYACHETRCLFWLEPYDATYMVSELFGVKSPAHVKHRLESLYWCAHSLLLDWCLKQQHYLGRNHWSLFPVVFDGRSIPLGVYDELVGILSHGCMDVMTSKSSTLPYDDETMQKMIKLIQKAKVSDAGVVYHTAGITRLLSFFAHWRFLYFHGQRHARLVRHQTVYSKSKRERSLLITLLSPVLFLAPEVHLQEVEKLWTDEIIIETVWKSFMTKLLGEWEDVILWSTVMLTANVGFLAIPGVILSNLSGSTLTSASQVVIFTSPAQIASSLSIEASVGSIVIGLLLVRHNRSKQKEDPAGASTYLYRNTHRVFGLEPMAIIFSLPWAMLMWSMVIFFIALLLLCFEISNISTRIFVAVMSVMIAALISWCIRSIWETSEDREVWLSDLLPSLTRAIHHARAVRRRLFPLDDFGLHRTPATSHPLRNTGSLHSMIDRDGSVGV
ncbi:hypothetical protein B0F90DRAFT_1936389 [Multifurca ochricompacta]|uniref:Uncharacterized protein n=1 Tax=Multifurca ochricompacta TaxID=376703 RepID=A0AAD4M4A8_9AGAM|nr:hypothetical protein B0F90DRAFT_1936389 [Multifurca ochricompacta]